MAIINIIRNQQSQQIDLIQEDISDQLGGGVVVFFSSQPFLAKSLQVFLNGLNLRLDADFSEVGNQSFRFINYDANFIRTINSSYATLAIKYFKESVGTSSISQQNSMDIESKKELKIEKVLLFEEDLSDQILFGINRVYLSNNFKENSLILESSNFGLQKDIDYTESGLDSINIINKEKIKNKNLIAKYIIG